MKLREKIIILVAVLVGAYGLLDFFVLSGRGDVDTDRVQVAEQELESFATTVSANIALAKITDRAHMGAIISKAESGWSRDPFRAEVIKEVEVVSEESEEAGPELVYSGFIQAGERVLAVVNGMEYRTGDLLNEVGYKVVRITPSQVLLQTDTSREIILYLEEN